MRRLIGRFTIAVLLGLSLLAYQFLLFNYLYNSSDEVPRADAVVVFDGMAQRIRAGFKLLNEGRAPLGIISPATQAQIKNYIQEYGSPKNVQFLIEPRARTTYENAFFASEIISAEKLKSVILVTSQDHMPRAFLLLETMLVGKQVRIYRMPVGMPPAHDPIWREGSIKEKLIYNEMVKLWGSLYEMAAHKITGRMAPRTLRNSKPIKALEKEVLME